MEHLMHAQLQAKCEAFVAAHRTLSSGFMWDHQLIKQFGALNFIQSNFKGEPDVARIQELRKYIKEQTGIFSPFRGMNELMVAILLYLNPQQEAWLDRALHIYSMMKAAGFSASTYLPLSAMVVADSERGSDAQVEQRIGRMQQFYKGFKQHHFWLTSQDDYIYAALLSGTALPVDAAIDQIEGLYQALHSGGIPKGNGLQSLTHVLCLGEQAPQIKVDKALTCYRLLSEAGYKLSTYHLAYLGVLALVTDTPQALIDEAVAVSQWLKGQKGFGGLSLDKKTRLVMAASLCIQHYIEDVGLSSVAVLANSLQSIIVAEQIAATTAIIAATSAATSASSSS